MAPNLLHRLSPLSSSQAEWVLLWWMALRGILISAFGAFLYSCTGVLTKVICSAGMPILNLLLFRFITQSVLCVGICLWRRLNPFKYLNPKTSLAKFLYARGIIAVICHALYYVALSKLPLGDASAVGLSATIWAAFLGAIIQHEGLGWLWSMVVVCSLGILLIAKPGVMNEALGGGTRTADNSGDEIGFIDDLSKGAAFLILVIGAFLHGVSFVLGRHVAQRGPPVLSILLMMFFGLIFFLPTVLLISPYKAELFATFQPNEWLALAALPVLGLGAQLCLISALEFESAAMIAIVQNLDAVFSYIFQLAIGEGCNVASLCGAGLIVCSAVVLAFFTIKKWMKTDRPSLPSSSDAAADAAAANTDGDDVSVVAVPEGKQAAAGAGAAAADAEKAAADAATAAKQKQQKHQQQKQQQQQQQQQKQQQQLRQQD